MGSPISLLWVTLPLAQYRQERPAPCTVDPLLSEWKARSLNAEEAPLLRCRLGGVGKWLTVWKPVELAEQIGEIVAPDERNRLTQAMADA